jgi:hypothetical protein
MDEQLDAKATFERNLNSVLEYAVQLALNSVKNIQVSVKKLHESVDHGSIKTRTATLEKQIAELKNQAHALVHGLGLSTREVNTYIGKMVTNIDARARFEKDLAGLFGEYQCF